MAVVLSPPLHPSADHHHEAFKNTGFPAHLSRQNFSGASQLLSQQGKIVDDLTGFLAYLEAFPRQAASDHITVDVYVQALVSELLVCLQPGERKGIADRIDRWEAQRLHDLRLEAEKEKNVKDTLDHDVTLPPSKEAGEKKNIRNHGKIVQKSGNFLAEGLEAEKVEDENRFVEKEAGEIDVGITEPGANAEFLSTLGGVVELVDPVEPIEDSSALRARRRNEEKANLLADPSSYAEHNRNKKDGKLDKEEKEELMATVAASVEHMVGLAHGIGGRITEDNKVLDSLNSKLDSQNDALQVKNKTARDMLWSSKMGFMTQMFLFALSITIFFGMTSFILATKIINW
ncbi:unnamed protein product [Amoebophrya sp. A25]|nr:unnamed protein product [Amoebophrya sp. A25]|eukprot:GSA25T00018970001.1